MRKFLYPLVAFAIVMLVTLSPSTSLATDLSFNQHEKKEQIIIRAFDSSHHYSDEEIINFYNDIGEPIDYVESSYSLRAANKYSSYFNWIKWINRSGEWSLSVMPFRSKVPLIMFDPSGSFNYIQELYRPSEHWQKYLRQGADESMEAQYRCHVYKANFIKMPWNLEPFRKAEDIGFLCN